MVAYKVSGLCGQGGQYITIYFKGFYGVGAARNIGMAI